jgi:hypothetical protein
MRGADILETVVSARKALSTSQVAYRLTDVYDGRKVRRRCEKLADAGLVELTNGMVLATARGKEVDAILARIVAARGGTFAPWLTSGITSSETLALQK